MLRHRVPSSTCLEGVKSTFGIRNLTYINSWLCPACILSAAGLPACMLLSPEYRFNWKTKPHPIASHNQHALHSVHFASTKLVSNPTVWYTVISPLFIMKSLAILSSEGRYHHPQNDTICSRLRRIFKGPPNQQAHPQYRDEKEKKYRHVPTHSASSFVKTTTTAAMIVPEEHQHTDGRRSQDMCHETPPAADSTLPPQSLI